MADDPTKPKASADSTPEQLRELAREWFAEAREASVHDDAEVKTWKEGMKELGWCLSRNFWDRVDWSNDS